MGSAMKSTSGSRSSPACCPRSDRAIIPKCPRIRPHDFTKSQKVESIQRKAKQHKWAFSEALDKADDIVGHRIVCHNLQDVERVVGSLEASLKADGIHVQRSDYVKHPQSTGYRAIHLVVRLPIQIGPIKRKVGCEIQVRSLLQNSWAELSRTDIYTKEETLSPALLTLMTRLADMLKVADDIANDIRQEISKPPAEAKTQPVDASKITAATPPEQITLAFATAIQLLYRQAFKQDAGGYLVEVAAQEIGNDLKRLETLQTLLGDRRLLKRFRANYQNRAGWEPDDAQLFRWAAHAAATGIPETIKLVRKEAEQDFAEVDTIARREILSDLPGDWQELVDEMEHPSKDGDIAADIQRWASAFNTVDDCGICSAAIVDCEALAEAIAEHYGIEGDEADEARERIDRAIFNSGVELGGGGGLCSYHAEVMRRDD
jgi:ppGpp synthetase/RelA/SpoT-type nucleotidyltranferase